MATDVNGGAEGKGEGAVRCGAGRACVAYRIGSGVLLGRASVVEEGRDSRAGQRDSSRGETSVCPWTRRRSIGAQGGGVGVGVGVELEWETARGVGTRRLDFATRPAAWR
jgi:hypothetical protein